MADDSIIIPGCQEVNDAKAQISIDPTYLAVDKHLTEWDGDADAQNDARKILGLSGNKDLVDKSESATGVYGKWAQMFATDIVGKADEISKSIANSAVQEHELKEDVHGINAKIVTALENYIKKDGTTPFEGVQKCNVNTNQITDNKALTTLELVKKLIAAHSDKKATASDYPNGTDPHGVLRIVGEILLQYVKNTEIIPKSQLYTKSEVDSFVKGSVKSSGTVPFTAPQSGVDPISNSHLTTKRYVDNSLYKHLTDVDPHGFLTILNNRLVSYAKKSDVFDKTQTYSRTQIDNIIYKLVDEAVQATLADYKETIDNRFETLRNENYVKQNGSVPFLEPQSGVDAVNPENLVTLRQLLNKNDELQKSLEKKFGGSIWKTSGPVLTTVGYLEDNTPVPEEMSFQEVCDAIFYGSGISIDAPKHVDISKECEITVCVKGSTGLIQTAQLFQNGELIYTFVGSDFEDGCVTVKSKTISEDTEFEFKVTYTNGSQHEETAKVQCQMPVFVGILPYFRFGDTVTMGYLQELINEDSSQNKFISEGKDFNEITFNYNFVAPKLKQPFVVLPNDYPNLTGMTTKTQQFGVDAFEKITLPMKIEGVEKEVLYKMYIYREALATLNQEVTFNFE